MARTVAYERKTKDAPKIDRVLDPDWAQLILEICGTGIPKKQIHERCEISREILYSILRGASVPYWRQGQMILALHARVVPAKPATKSLFALSLEQIQ